MKSLMMSAITQVFVAFTDSEHDVVASCKGEGIMSQKKNKLSSPVLHSSKHKRNKKRGW